MTVHKAPSHIYKRFCNDCGELYNPTGRYQKYCEKCLKKRKLVRNKKK